MSTDQLAFDDELQRRITEKIHASLQIKVGRVSKGIGAGEKPLACTMYQDMLEPPDEKGCRVARLMMTDHTNASLIAAQVIGLSIMRRLAAQSTSEAA